jgi:hypothetical protein
MSSSLPDSEPRKQYDIPGGWCALDYGKATDSHRMTIVFIITLCDFQEML